MRGANRAGALITFEYSPIIWLPLCAAVMLLALAVHGQSHLRRSEVRYFQALCLLTATWSVFQAADLALTSVDEKVLVMKLKFTVAPFISVAIFGLLASHSGRASMLTPRNLALISAIPVTTVLLAYTSELHALFIYSFHMPSSGPSILQWSPGPLFWLYVVSTYGLIIAGVILTLSSVREANRLYQKQAIVLIVSLLPPAVFEVLTTLEVLPRSLEDMALAAFAISALIMAAGLKRYRILDVRPIARGEVVENIPDAILAVDSEDRLIDLNRSAEPLLTMPAERALGVHITKALRPGAEIAALLSSPGAHAEIVTGRGSECRRYDVSILPIEVKNELRARMVLMRDITDRQRAEEALHAVNDRLDLLSSMTRHDLLNRLAVIEGYISLAMKEKEPERLSQFMQKMERTSEAMRTLIEFTGDYERVGIKAPSWLRVDEVFARAASQLQLDDIEVSVRVDGLSVYADAMLEKVFYNLIDNSLSHGGHVSRISLEFEEHRDRLSLVYRDDGVGVPGKEKPMIFLRGFGANTGLGLFLAREVLAITGIEIAENGVQGKGARFEMVVPDGGFRLEEDLEDTPKERTMGRRSHVTRATAHPSSCPTTH